MPSDTPMERLEAMAVDREVEAETIRGNKFRSHAYALEHELAASDLRWALAELRRLTADCARKDAALEPFGEACIAQMKHLQRMGITIEPDYETVSLPTFTIRDVRRAAGCWDAHLAAASARGEGSGR